MSKSRLFLYSLVLTTICLLAIFYLNRAQPSPLKLVRIAGGVYISAQLQPGDVGRFAKRGGKTIVDIRPDGESREQASSAEIESATVHDRMAFRYAPVPHDTIPESAVEVVGDVLAHDGKPVLLYCRSGHRAARTFALAAASQPDGPGIDAILGAVRAAGFSAEDMRADITDRISRRNTAPAVVAP